MYDSVNFKLLQSEAGGVDFLEETPYYLENVGEHNYNGDIVITGELRGLKVSLNRYQMKLRDGSLCKWYLGDNFKTMGRGDTERAIEKLSDTLHLPMDKAIITRIDIAQNFIMQKPTEVYMNHLGVLKHSTRLQEPSGLYYKLANGCLCFYDKVKEQKSNHQPIPDLYVDRNVLRYEQRYTSRIASQLGVEAVTSSLLYDEAFYIRLLDGWKNSYRAIQKINDTSLNFGEMKTKQQLYKMGVLSLIEQTGGILAMYEQINEAQKSGELTKKQAYDLRQAVKESSQIRKGLTIPNESIKELDKKINEAVKFYR